MKFRFSQRAFSDLREIGDYIARDNTTRSISFVDELTARCRQIADFPYAGAPRPEFGAETRIVPFGQYVIVYVVRRDLLEIRRVVHSARDLSRLL